jgi:thiamine biosynthesis protein ThiI
MDKVILIKLGEIWLKGKNRDDFINRLVFNIQQASGINRRSIEVAQGRVYLKTTGNKQQVTNNLKYIFGIHSFTEIQKVPPDLGEIKKVLHVISNKEITGGAKTFKIEARRADKNFPKTSIEIARELGAAVLENFSEKLKVDAKNPDFVLNAEIRPEGTFIYSNNDEIEGAGGLPVGVSGRGLLMISGGIDSPVAGWLAMKRGMRIDAVHFASPPYTGERAKEKVVNLCRVLAPYNAGSIKLFVVPFTEIQVRTSKGSPKNLWTLLHRRFMVQIAGGIAQEEKYNALISGESLGQVASQTIENIRAVSYNIDFPILRPLIGFDKQESINLAKKIGTYPISILPYEDCCVVFSSDNPKTKAKEDEIAKWEERFDGKKLIDEAINERKYIEISRNL